MKKDMTVAEKLEYEQKAVAIAASAVIGIMGALVGGMGIAFAVIAGGAAMTAGGGGGGGVGLSPRHFGKRIADIRSCVVTVHGLELSCHKLTSYYSAALATAF